MKKEDKNKIIILLSVILLIALLLTTVSAGILNWIKKTISGKATQNLGLNITVGVPSITTVYNSSISLGSGPNEAPAITTMVINFTAYTISGAVNLNHSTARINVTGDTTRQNLSCANTASSGNYANYTCNITMWWWDGTGTWNITAYVEDNQTNSAMNTSTNFYVGSRTSFVMGPSSLTWPGIAPGATNKTSSNDPLLLNNTGNDVINATSIKINASNLRGETTPTQALWAENFSVSWNTGGACTGANCVECGGTVMNRSIYQAIATANLTKGNYTINDGSTGQEELYFCLRLAGSELSNQAYSTANETEWAWIVQTS